MKEVFSFIFLLFSPFALSVNLRSTDRGVHAGILAPNNSSAVEHRIDDILSSAFQKHEPVSKMDEEEERPVIPETPQAEGSHESGISQDESKLSNTSSQEEEKNSNEKPQGETDFQKALEAKLRPSAGKETTQKEDSSREMNAMSEQSKEELNLENPKLSAAQIQANALALSGYAEQELPEDDPNFSSFNLDDPLGDKNKRSKGANQNVWSNMDMQIRSMDAGVRPDIQLQMQKEAAMQQQKQQQEQLMALQAQQQQQQQQQQQLMAMQAQNLQE